MDWLWPGFLLLLLLVPALIGVYIIILRRRRPVAARYSSLALVRAAAPRPRWWRRHLPFALFLTGLASLVIAMGRPVTVVSVPAGKTTIILAIDVSRSMCATDIAPNRLEAAKAAALSFIRQQDQNTQISIVAFAGFAEIVQTATSDQDLLAAAVKSLTTARRTAIGQAILKSIDAIAEIDTSVARSIPLFSSQEPPIPVAAGAYAPAIIVVLTDGVNNAGMEPLEAAQQAADRGLRVYTIGYGTDAGSDPDPECNRVGGANDPFGGGGGFFGGGGGFGGGFNRGIDQATLTTVAEMTGGEYYAASSADELNTVFEQLPTYLITKHETTEVSVAFTAVGALLAGLAVLLALYWNPLP
ncbi:MAG: VWA domain-containing protein [Anaerolineales bacterium]|nr:VWA domain-containing protein [Anaerolineales bacterium]